MYPPVYTFYKIIREWYSATRVENWSHNTHIQKRATKVRYVNNYRPVCLTSIANKVFESNIRDTMSKYL